MCDPGSDFTYWEGAREYVRSPRIINGTKKKKQNKQALYLTQKLIFFSGGGGGVRWKIPWPNVYTLYCETKKKGKKKRKEDKEPKFRRFCVIYNPFPTPPFLRLEKAVDG